MITKVTMYRTPNGELFATQEGAKTQADYDYYKELFNEVSEDSKSILIENVDFEEFSNWACTNRTQLQNLIAFVTKDT